MNSIDFGFSGYSSRPPREQDFEQVVAVLVASELADSGRSILGADFVSGQWARPGFGLGSDAHVVTDEAGTVVGYAQVEFQGPNVVESWGAVHPAHRARIVGPALFGWIEQRAGSLLARVDSPLLRHKIDAADKDAAALLRLHGLRPVRHFWHMEIDLEAEFEFGLGVSGVVIAAIDVERDLPAVHAVIDAAMAEHWGEHSESYERWIAEQSADPGYDPSLWLLAVIDDAPVGALTMSRSDSGAWIDYLGVLAPYRGRGIAGALLRRAFAQCADLGLSRVLLSVDSDNASGATAVYERAGMRLVAGWDVWERSLSRS